MTETETHLIKVCSWNALVTASRPPPAPSPAPAPAPPPLFAPPSVPAPPHAHSPGPPCPTHRQHPHPQTRPQRPTSWPRHVRPDPQVPLARALRLLQCWRAGTCWGRDPRCARDSRVGKWPRCPRCCCPALFLPCVCVCVCVECVCVCVCACVLGLGVQEGPSVQRSSEMAVTRRRTRPAAMPPSVCPRRHNGICFSPLTAGADQAQGHRTTQQCAKCVWCGRGHCRMQVPSMATTERRRRHIGVKGRAWHTDQAAALKWRSAGGWPRRCDTPPLRARCCR